MATRTTIILAVAPLVALAVGAALLATREQKGASAPVAAFESTSAPPALLVAATNATTLKARQPVVLGTLGAVPQNPTVTPAPPLQEEPSLMAQLREMRQSDPELSLRLAREGNERFPGSPDAAERAAIVVKSLMRMGRADEATDEARTMVEKYAGTTWALDVKRHMLDIPSQ
jgi:hypothetical protein